MKLLLKELSCDENILNMSENKEQLFHKRTLYMRW